MTDGTKHTPGPWKAFPSDPADGAECYYLTAVELRGEIACIYGPQRDEQEANARLIAAAPELLEALEGLLAHLGPDGYIPNAGGTATERARAAIAKATGAA